MKPSPPVQQSTQEEPNLTSSFPASSPSFASVPTNCRVTNGLPDSQCTPGATNPDVKQGTIGTTICYYGYSSSVRPPVSYTDPLKTQLMQSYGFTDSKSNYELDHLIPLEVGGAAFDVKNLWPEPRYGEPNAGEKDRFENYLHDQVCSGLMGLDEAQNEIATDWFKYWDEAGRP
ncbi:MAG: hypothetical protein AUG16_02680 [Thaumarchaeota archaeon 13_1_20CM_2_39_20]|nr:MAG: hypothetical protein AUG16_02680 [Thaumarchaeota archaeon 13_1_20CM_2_39_20]